MFGYWICLFTIESSYHVIEFYICMYCIYTDMVICGLRQLQIILFTKIDK